MDRSRRCCTSPGTPKLAIGLTAVLLATSVTQNVTAQRLQGRLLDLESNEPIASGVLTLLTEGGIRVATVVTDDGGNWVLETPRPGIYLIEAKRLGYQPWVDGPVEVEPGDDATFVYHLRPAAIPLTPVEISAAATERYLDLSGFYQRQRSDFGHFMTPEDIERRRATRITELLSTIPGVRIVSTGQIGQSYIQLRGSALYNGGVCRPRVYVDGLMFLPGDGRRKQLDMGNVERMFEEDPDLRLYDALRVDDIAHPSTIAAIEVYRSGAQVPVQFGGTSIEAQCGVIVVWTRVGRMRTFR